MKSYANVPTVGNSMVVGVLHYLSARPETLGGCFGIESVDGLVNCSVYGGPCHNFSVVLALRCIFIT